MDAIPRAIELLAGRVPDVAVTVRDSDPSSVARADALRRGELDAALDDFPLPDGPFDAVESLPDPTVLAVAPGAPLAPHGDLDGLAALDGLPLVADAGWPMLPFVEGQL